MNLTGVQGSDLAATIQVPNVWSGPQLAGMKVAFLVKEYATDPDTAAVVNLATDLNASAGIAVTTPGSVVQAAITIPAATTAALIPGRTYQWALKLLLPNGISTGVASVPQVPSSAFGVLALTAGAAARLT